MQVASMEDEPKHESQERNNTAVKVKVPKRVLHFSDGVLEEYSDDEVDADNAPAKQEIAVVNPVSKGFAIGFKRALKKRALLKNRICINVIAVQFIKSNNRDNC